MDTNSTQQFGRVRWGVNFAKWFPDDDQWNYALSLVEPEEKERILK